MRTLFKTLLAAFVVVTMVAIAGCDKDDINTSNNSGNGTENPIPQPTPNPGQDTTLPGPNPGQDTTQPGPNPGQDTTQPGPNPPQPQGMWVDLGLPSGLLWASYNLGATAPEEYGGYFAWGETTTKSDYGWSTYAYCTVDGDGVVDTLTKYNTVTEYGTVDNLTTLQPGDDAATAILGNGARTPTKDDWQELIANTTPEWTTLNGVNGRRFTASNGNSLFLPAAGSRSSSGLLRAGTVGAYWSASLNTEYPTGAWRCYFSVVDQGISPNYRYYGFSVRAVRAPQN